MFIHENYIKNKDFNYKDLVGEKITNAFDYSEKGIKGTFIVTEKYIIHYYSTSNVIGFNIILKGDKNE